jgi:apolipoprotein N-acyltransferase
MTMNKSNLSPRLKAIGIISPFLIATVFLMFSNGRFPIASCVWLGSVFMLHFTRGGRGGVRLLLAYVGLSFAFGFQFYGMTPFGGVGYWIFSAAFGLTLALPYIADRYLGPRWHGLRRSLVFPLALVVSEYAASFNPFGTWGSIAYSQYEHLPLLQLVSVTGLYGLTFLIGWFSSVAQSLWQAGLDVNKARNECFAFALCLTAVVLYGEGRLTIFPPSAPTIRVASITRPDENLFPYPPSANLNRRVMMGEPLTDAETAQLHQRSNAIANFLFARADTEAQAGAKLVTFGEFNFPVLLQYEPDLIQQAAEVAQRRGIYIGVPMAVFNIGHKPSLDDKLVMIEPSGHIAWEYRKSEIPPGLEVAILTPSAGQLPFVDAPSGRLGAAIAFDMDFPSFLVQAGRKHVDLMVVPENEYPQIDPIHSRMALYRALENGFNLLLHASQSLSLACDYQGRVLGLMDHYHASDRVLVAELPTRGVTTIYSRCGYLFPWVCIVGICGVLASAILRPNSQIGDRLDTTRPDATGSEHNVAGCLIPLVAGGALAAYNPKLGMAAGGGTLAIAAIFKKGTAWWILGFFILALALFFYWNKQNAQPEERNEKA